MPPPGFKERFLFWVIGILGPWLLRLLGALCRYRVEGEQNVPAAQSCGRGVILALWHGRMMLPVYHFRGRGISALVSLHRDGELVTRVVRKLGYVIRRGSPRKGGREGFLAMVRDLRSGRAVAMFPDGPTGPRHELHDGLLQLARITGAPIVPLSYAAKPTWRFNSWDRHMVMKPFGRGLLLIGEPFTVPQRIRQEDMDGYREMIRGRLVEIERQADRRMGVAV